MKNKILFGALIFLLVLLVACSQEKKAEEQKNISEPLKKDVVQSVTITEKTIPDLCKEVKCKENEVCSEGKCSCAQNFKQCKESCIPNSSCCTSLDCQPREECSEGQCAKIKLCDFNQHFDEAKKECACDEKTKWCKDQNKCIKYDTCCDELSCNPIGSITRLCKKTVFLPTVCVKSGTGQHCTIVAEGGRESFNILGDEGDIYVEKVYEQGASDIKLVYNHTTTNLSKLNLNEEKSFFEGYTAKIIGVDMRRELQGG